jgi:hypothetical protein
MPISPTPWAMEEPLLPMPDEILVTGGDAPPGIDAADTAARHAMAEPPAAHLDAGDGAAPRATQPAADAAMPADPFAGQSPTGTGEAGTALADGALPGFDPMVGASPSAPASPAAGQGAARTDTTFDPPAEDAFPTLAALDAIRAAFAADPPGPDAAARADFAVLLGLDPALAAEEATFLDALRDAPAPDGDVLLAEWLSEAAADVPPPWPVPAADWLFG